MTCGDFEKLIALDVEGDLPSQKTGSLTEHLWACGHCREFAAGLQASQAMLKELQDDAPDEATLREVRRGILNRLPAEPAPSLFASWRFALGAGLVAILILAIIVLRHPSGTPAPHASGKKEAPMTLEAVRQPPTAPLLTPAQSLEHPRAERRKRPLTVSQHGNLPWQHHEPLTVKLITDNPNVVIYWQVD